MFFVRLVHDIPFTDVLALLQGRRKMLKCSTARRSLGRFDSVTTPCSRVLLCDISCQHKLKLKKTNTVDRSTFSTVLFPPEGLTIRALIEETACHSCDPTVTLGDRRFQQVAAVQVAVEV
jgi:hypothetical protein